MALSDPTPVDESTRLGCGRDIDDVWANIDHPPDDHEVNCPDCQDARANLADLNAAAREMLAGDIADPQLHTDPDVLDNIISIARTEIRRGRSIPFRQPRADGPIGELAVSEQAVATVIRRASDLVVGVEARRCRIDFESIPPIDAARHDPSLDPASNATAISIALSITVTGGQPIPPLIERLRERVSESVAAVIGLRVNAIDVTVEDLHDA